MHIEHNFAKRKCQEQPKTRFLVVLLSLVGSIGLILHIHSDSVKWPLATDSNQGCGNPLNLCIIITIKHKRAKNEAFGHGYQVKLALSCIICLNIMEIMLQRFVRRLVKRFGGFKVWRFEHLNFTKVEICALRHVAVELEPEKVVRLSVCKHKIWYFPSLDFAETWHDVWVQ